MKKKHYLILLIILTLIIFVGCQKNEKELTTNLWNLKYSNDWISDQDSFTDDDDESEARLKIMEGEESLIDLHIEAGHDSFRSYKDILKREGIDVYEMVENNAGTYIELDGIKFIEVANADKNIISYYSRVENAATTISLKIEGDYKDPRVEEILKTIKFTIEDKGETDPPWPWNGTPTSMDNLTAMVGDFKIESQWIAFEEPVVVDSYFTGEIEYANEQLKILIDKTLYNYSIGEKLKYVNDFDIEISSSILSSDKSGNVYAVSKWNLVKIADTINTISSQSVDSVVMHPSGEWGISYSYSEAPRKFIVEGNILNFEDWNLVEGIETVSDVFISDNHIFVTGSGEDSKKYMWVYDLSRNLKFVLGRESDSIGSISKMLETANGFIGFDGNLRMIHFWKLDGTYIGGIEDSEIFGTSYPWMSGATLMPDGSILVSLTETRADESAEELLVYRITGF